MENTGLLHPENNTAGGGAATGIPNGERNPKTTPLASSALRRKRLSDITNLASDGRAVARSFAGGGGGGGGGKENVVAAGPSASTRDAYIAQLLKENNALMRALGERNKVIELSAAEIQNLRFTLQKVTQQNHQLAQANSQMLAERNQDKDRLKAFQHEMGCQKAVIKAKTLELEEKRKLIRQLKAMIATEQITEGHTKLDHVVGDAPILTSHKKACNTNRKRTLRTRSLGSASLTHQVGVKEKDESSRKSSRRRSIGLKHERCEPSEDLFEIEDVNFPILSLASDPISEDSSGQVDYSAPSVPNATAYPVKEEEEEQGDQSGTPQVHNHGLRRSSVGRPTRRAAEKVNSYKEAPLNVKMRRPQ